MGRLTGLQASKKRRLKHIGIPLPEGEYHRYLQRLFFWGQGYCLRPSNQHEKQGYEEDRQKCGCQHSAEDTGPNRMAARRPSARRSHEWQDAENKGHRRHDDRTKSQAGRVERGIDDRASFRHPFIGTPRASDRRYRLRRYVPPDNASFFIP